MEVVWQAVRRDLIRTEALKAQGGLMLGGAVTLMTHGLDIQGRSMQCIDCNDLCYPMPTEFKIFAPWH